MKQTLQLKLSQHLTLTPQLQQSIRLLQLSTVELNAEVERMLQENPLLEKLETEEDGTPTEFAGSAATAPGPVETRSATSEDQERVDGAEREGSYENADRPDFEDYSSGDGDWGSGGGGTDQDDDGFYPQQVATSTLRDHLLSQ